VILGVKINILFNGLSMDYPWTIYGLSMEGLRYVLKANNMGCLYYYLESFQNPQSPLGVLGKLYLRFSVRFALRLRPGTAD